MLSIGVIAMTPSLLLLLLSLSSDVIAISNSAKSITPIVSNIPLELCLDDSKPIDEGEDKTVTEKLVGNTLANEDNISFDKLPSEVQKIIRLTTSERYISAKFHLAVILSHDPIQENRSVKSYIYTPLVFNNNINAITLATDHWTFKRQDQMLKLDEVEVDTALR